MISAIIFVLLITLGIGLPLTLWIAPKHNLVGRLGLSYLLGIGLFTLLMYGANFLNLKLTFINNVLLFLVVSLPLCFFQGKSLSKFRIELIDVKKGFHPTFIEKIILWASGFFVVSSFANTLYWPVYIWDALSLYDFRALVFAQTGFIKSALNALGGGFYFAYPLLTSLSHTIVYLTGGNNPQFLYSMFYLSLGLVFYGLLHEFISRNLSLVFTLVLLTVSRVFTQSIISYTNLPYMCYFSLGAIYFYIWSKSRTQGYLILSSLLIGLSSWTRSSEPFWMVILGLLILVSIFKKKFKDIVVFILLFFPIQLAWENFQSSSWSKSSTVAEVSSSLAAISGILNVKAWLEVINFFYKNIIYNWGAVFLLFVAAFIVSFFNKKFKKYYGMFFITFSLLAFFS